jgi:hypothetical protein
MPTTHRYPIPYHNTVASALRSAAAARSEHETRLIQADPNWRDWVHMVAQQAGTKPSRWHLVVDESRKTAHSSPY